MRTTLTRLLAVALTLGLVAAACGDDDEPSADPDVTESTVATTGDTPDTTEETAENPDTTEGRTDTAPVAAGAVDLASVCPERIVIQKDWNPEAEHGALYEMLGKEGYEIDASAAIVSGDLVTGGEDTGVDLEIRSGGPAIGFQQVTAQMYSDDAITMGYVSTDEAISNYAELPTIGVVAPLEINPQIIMWDPETYPEVQSIADLKDVEGGPAIIRYFGTATYMPDLVGRGIVLEEQLDGSYDGTPAQFVAAGGEIAQQGFASAEPYVYENEIPEWGKPVAFELIHDAGLQAYAAAIAMKPETFGELSASGCLEALVPVIQQAQVDYITNPAATNEVILELVEAYDNGWVYTPEVADFSVQQQLDLGLVGNGPDDTLGNFDMERVAGVIETLDAVAAEVGYEPTEGLTAEDLVTNEFIDESIGLP